MKQLLSIVVLSVLSVTGHAVTVEKTANLNVYYPEYTKIDLICGQMPKSSEKDVEFCCEAAFTGELLNEFKHTNIADNHICNGEMKKGYRCKANTGGFVWGKGNDVVAQDTIFSFLGKPIEITGSVLLIIFYVENLDVGS